jgi:hypothetical protein
VVQYLLRRDDRRRVFFLLFPYFLRYDGYGKLPVTDYGTVHSMVAAEFCDDDRYRYFTVQNAPGIKAIIQDQTVRERKP